LFDGFLEVAGSPRSGARVATTALARLAAASAFLLVLGVASELAAETDTQPAAAATTLLPLLAGALPLVLHAVCRRLSTADG